MATDLNFLESKLSLIKYLLIRLNDHLDDEKLNKDDIRRTLQYAKDETKIVLDNINNEIERKKQLSSSNPIINTYVLLD